MKNYYVLNNGRVRRDQNTIFIDNEATGARKPIPVEDVDCLYLYGEIDLNTKLLNFLTQKHIPLHVFNYYGFYAGSYYPREYLHSGYIVVQQVGHYADPARRLALARETVRASSHSMLKNIAYYARRAGAEPETEPDRDPDGEIAPPEDTKISYIPADAEVEGAVDGAVAGAAVGDADPEPEGTGDGCDPIEGIADSTLPDAGSLREVQATIISLAGLIDAQTDVDRLRGIEGKMRERYYSAWNQILREGWTFDRRVRRPPDNEVNALISFGNSIVYTNCTSEIYRTQLTPTISYLHEPGARRFSLSLDLSELFKPLIVDRAIFKLINNRQLTENHFDKSVAGCVLNDAGKKLYIQALEDRFNSTIKHRRLNRHVSYRHLIRLECYKLIRHFTGIEPYRAFRAWW